MIIVVCFDASALTLTFLNFGKVIFFQHWSHYAKVMEWYEANDTVFMPKEANPPNSPALRPIQKFWAIMKGKLRNETTLQKHS